MCPVSNFQGKYLNLLLVRIQGGAEETHVQGGAEEAHVFHIRITLFSA